VLPTTIRDGLAMYRVGEGEPLLVFPYPHAMTVSSMAEGSLVEVLLRCGRSVITFDPPGAYASERPGLSTLDEMVACARETVGHLGVDEPLDVAGHSMGAFCALALAVDVPSMVRRLVLVGALSGFPAVKRWGMPHNWRWWRDREWWEVGWYGTRTVLGWDDLAVHKELSNAVEKASYVDTTLAPQWSIAPGDRGRPAPSRVEWQRNVRHYDLVPGLPGIEIPVLLLYGRHDPQTPLQMAEQLRDLLPEARLVVFDNSGHSPFVEEPQAFGQAVAEFLGPRPGSHVGAAAASSG